MYTSMKLNEGICDGFKTNKEFIPIDFNKKFIAVIKIYLTRIYVSTIFGFDKIINCV